MSDKLNTLAYFRSEFYNEYPSTFSRWGRGTLGSFSNEDFGKNSPDPTPSDTYTKEEIDSMLDTIRESAITSIEVRKDDGDDDYITATTKSNKTVIDIDRADSSDIDNLLQTCD